MNLGNAFFTYGVYLPVAGLQAGNIMRAYRRLLATERQTAAAMQAQQLEKLRTLLAWSRDEIPFHRDRLASIGRGPASFADFAQIEPMTKQMLQQFGSSVRTSRAGRYTTKTTGGSTGQAVTIWKDRNAWCQELAATWRGYHWAGIGMGDKQARFWGTPLSGRHRWRALAIDTVCRRRRFSAFDYDDETIDRYLARLRRFRPRYLYGYVSMIREMASHIVRNGLDLGLDLACVITTSEVLSDQARTEIEQAFRTRVYNEYGCGEIGTIAHECEDGSLHLSDENMIVEILDGDRPCPPGETGEIVITELNNRAMPLIRYRMGDFGYIQADGCACGRTLRVLGGVHGRAYDSIVNREGRRFHGEFVMYVFEEIKAATGGIRQFQVTQDDYDSFSISIVPDDGYGAHIEDAITARVREFFDRDARISFQIVESIDRERSGKLRLIRGFVEHGRRDTSN